MSIKYKLNYLVFLVFTCVVFLIFTCVVSFIITIFLIPITMIQILDVVEIKFSLGETKHSRSILSSQAEPRWAELDRHPPPNM